VASFILFLIFVDWPADPEQSHLPGRQHGSRSKKLVIHVLDDIARLDAR